VDRPSGLVKRKVRGRKRNRWAKEGEKTSSGSTGVKWGKVPKKGKLICPRRRHYLAFAEMKTGRGEAGSLVAKGVTKQES